MLRKSGQVTALFSFGGTMKFYYVSREYIDYLKQFEPKIQHNYDKGVTNQKPYIGVVFKINDWHYYAPLSSPKIKFNAIVNNSPTTVKLITNKQEFIGIISLNNMLPIPLSEVEVIDFQQVEITYRHLLLKQYRILSSKNIEQEIQRKAEKIYQLVVKSKQPHFKKLSCDFKLLEQKATLYHK